MANGTIQRGYSSAYYGSHRLRGLGLATSASDVVFTVPAFAPNGQAPQIQVDAFAVAGVVSTGMTCAVSPDRTSECAISFVISKANGFTNGGVYYCIVTATLSP